jgi:hypothetical protein
MEIVGAEGVYAFGTVVHLVAEPPEPVPLVREAVVPVVQELVHQDAGQRPAPRTAKVKPNTPSVTVAARQRHPRESS